MSFACLLLSACVLAAGSASAEEEVKKLESKELEKESKADAYAAMMKEKFLACKVSYDCEPYLLEKEKAKKRKEKEGLAPAKPQPEEAIEKPRKKPPVEGDRALAEPLEAPGTLVEPDAAPAFSGTAPTVEQTEVGRREAGQRRARTMTRAAGAADSMRRSFAPDDEAAPGASGALVPPDRPAAPAREEPREAFRPAEPRTVPEMALAATAGFAATYRDQGLKVGAGPRGEPAILRLNGSPASEADVKRLGAALRSDPAALTRRPDFFEVLPREKFSDLKKDYASRPELRNSAFKDIGMTAQERDFQWSASCSGLSGGCNPHAGKDSYRKGHDVPPEDLAAVWNAAQEELLDSDEEFGEYTEEDRRLAAAEDLAEEKLGGPRRGAPALASLLARIGDLARGAGESAGFFQGRSAGAPPPSPGPSDESGSPPRAAPPRASDQAGAPRVGAPSASPASPAPAGPGARRYRGLLYALAAAAGAFLLIRRR